ncbi:MAG: hypothetical protein ACT4PE_17960 [Candidatus Eiseniibacteriota bacterium]
MPAIEGVPDLRLVAPERIRFHEHPERSRTLRLVERLREERTLRNPPIVARLDGENHVLLDGANRVSALAELGYSHVPVQVIDYARPEVQLKGWHHLLLEGAKLDLHARYTSLAGATLERTALEDVAGLLALRQVFTILVDEAGAAWALRPGTARVELREWMAVIEGVVAAYEGKTRLERIKLADYAELPEVFRTVEHQLVLYPTITKGELLDLVSEGLRIPTGLTRHLIPGRALGLHLPLDFLRETWSDERKAKHFHTVVDELEMRGRIRFYEESVFVMNE